MMDYMSMGLTFQINASLDENFVNVKEGGLGVSISMSVLY